MTPRLSDTVKRWVNEALKADAGEDLVTWDVSMLATPDIDPRDPQGVVVRPSLLLYLEIDADMVADDGGPTHGYMSPILPPVLLSKEVVIATVNQALAEMRAEVAAQKSQLTTVDS